MSGRWAGFFMLFWDHTQKGAQKMKSKRKPMAGKKKSVLRDTEGRKLYAGALKHGKPYGYGTAYYAGGGIYQEGIFGIKGLLRGKEYYPNGQLRFRGEYRVNDAYGPNYPVEGKCYDPKGRLIYEGKLDTVRRGLGWPVVRKPESFGPVVQKEKPDVGWYMWWDEDHTGT